MNRLLPLLSVAGLLAFMLLLAGCGSSNNNSSGGEELAKVGKGEGALNIIVWDGYAQDGSVEKAYDWVHPFETATGCKVNAKPGGTSDEMVTLMRTGRYDGVSASGDASNRLIASGLVQAYPADPAALLAQIKAAAPRFSEDYQAEYYRQTLAMAAKIPVGRRARPSPACSGSSARPARACRRRR